MVRSIRVGAAQLGPISRDAERSEVVDRLVVLMRQASDEGCQLVVFPELALTTFFPRWYLDDVPEELDSYYETEMPGPETQPLFDEAKSLGIGFYLGYAELTPEKTRYNSAILVDADGSIVGRYRKVHMPGHEEHEPDRPFQHLERRYFKEGPDGFDVWEAFNGIIGMGLCNDRRWPETYRVMGLQGVELILIGYNTPLHYAPDPSQNPLQSFHNQLVMQAGAYQNATWVVGVAKAGCEEGFDMIGQSCIIAPSGEIVAMCRTMGDELIVQDCDLDAGRHYREGMFNFAIHRRPEHYGLIVQRTGAEPPLS